MKSALPIKRCLVMIFLLGASVAHTEKGDDDPLLGLRVGLLDPSGRVVWPVDTVPEENDWF